MLASRLGSISIIKLLLDCDAAPTPNHMGSNVLVFAYSNDHVEVTEFWLAKGAKPSSLRFTQSSRIQLILELGADLTSVKFCGYDMSDTFFVDYYELRFFDYSENAMSQSVRFDYDNYSIRSLHAKAFRYIISSVGLSIILR